MLFELIADARFIFCLVRGMGVTSGESVDTAEVTTMGGAESFRNG